MKYYELTCLISPDFSSEEIKAFSQKISDFILKEEGTLGKITESFRKKLAYPIKKRKEAFLITINFNFLPTADQPQIRNFEKLKNLEKKLKSEEQILRYIILTKEKPREIPKRIIPSKKIIKREEEEEETAKETIKPTRHKKVELKEIDKKIEEILNE